MEKWISRIPSSAITMEWPDMIIDTKPDNTKDDDGGQQQYGKESNTRRQFKLHTYSNYSP